MTVYTFFDTRRATNEGKYPLKIMISHQRQTVALMTVDHVPAGQFDEARGRYRGEGAAARQARLNDCLIMAEDRLAELRANGRLKNADAARAKELILAMEEDADAATAANSIYFADYFRRYADTRKADSTRKVYRYTLRRMEAFDPDLSVRTFDDIDRRYLQDLDSFFARTMTVNARGVNFRNIRAVFNAAIADDLTICYPFRTFKIRNEETRKRALPDNILRKLWKSDSFAGDWAKITLLLRGINAADLWRLRRPDPGEPIRYKRRKTGTLYEIRIEPELAALLEKHRGERHFLDIQDRFETDEGFRRTFNEELQAFCRDRTVTGYSLRHSWATVAARLDTPEATIAAGLGHRSAHRVTSIYINPDQAKVDAANRKVIDYINNL